MKTKILLSTPHGHDIDVKSGRVISSRNMGKIRQALELLTEVIESADNQQNKVNLVITGEQGDIEETKSLLQPVLDYYGVSVSHSTKSLTIEDADYLDEDTIEAIERVCKSLSGNFNLKV